MFNALRWDHVCNNISVFFVSRYVAAGRYPDNITKLHLHSWPLFVICYHFLMIQTAHSIGKIYPNNSVSKVSCMLGVVRTMTAYLGQFTWL